MVMINIFIDGKLRTLEKKIVGRLCLATCFEKPVTFNHGECQTDRSNNMLSLGISAVKAVRKFQKRHMRRKRKAGDKIMSALSIVKDAERKQTGGRWHSERA